VGWLHNESISGAGSLLITWNKEVFRCDNHVEDRGFIVMFGKHIKSKIKCVVVNVYATCNLNDNVTLWEE